MNEVLLMSFVSVLGTVSVTLLILFCLIMKKNAVLRKHLDIAFANEQKLADHLEETHKALIDSTKSIKREDQLKGTHSIIISQNTQIIKRNNYFFNLDDI